MSYFLAGIIPTCRTSKKNVMSNKNDKILKVLELASTFRLV
jgi:hypothetical protein